QLFPRLFTNYNETCIHDGSIEQNGCGKMNGFTPRVLNSIKELGVTHIWYTGVIEHAHATDYSKYGITPDNPHVVKGKAGSPYAISDYYDIDPDIAVNVPKRREEFEALVERTHAAGMKVIIDFVPNHVARRYCSDAKPVGINDFGANDDNSNFFSPFNDFYYISRQQFSPSIDLGQGDDAYIEFPAKASGNDCFSAFPDQNDWYETVKLNYGVDYGDGSCHFDPIPPVWFKMLHILRYWASKGIDGFRCDMVFMVPLEFWKWAIPAVKKDYPDLIFIGEIYDVNIYKDFLEAGFDYLYDKVNLYDTLRAIECSNVSAAQITDCWQRIDSVKDKMLNFLENHDEQRFASEFYAADPGLVIPSLVVSSTLSNGPVMIYAGQELGEPANDSEGFSGKDGRTTIFDYWSLSTLRRWLNSGKPSTDKLTDREKWIRNQYSKILSLCNEEKAISNGNFFDLMYVNYQNKTLDPHRQYVYIRYDKDSLLIIAVNFGSNSCDLMINIPQLAINMTGFKVGKYDAVELLSDKKAEKYFRAEQPFNTFVAPHSAVIWKLSKKKRTDNSKK
ncbi:MAG: alpha-amylase family protein, partial [Muribaculaceae bacterium]|nr:alpha-amylase family protein [Muribaculaceae bacterium]